MENKIYSKLLKIRSNFEYNRKESGPQLLVFDHFYILSFLSFVSLKND